MKRAVIGESWIHIQYKPRHNRHFVWVHLEIQQDFHGHSFAPQVELEHLLAAKGLLLALQPQRVLSVLDCYTPFTDPMG